MSNIDMEVVLIDEVEIQPIKGKHIHFDNSFPPISNQITLIELRKWMDIDYPDIKVVKPKYKKTVHL